MPGTPNRSGGDRHSIGPDHFPDDKMPTPAKDLCKAEKDVFAFLIASIPNGILRTIDTVQLSHLARLITRERTLWRAVKKDPGDLATGRQHLQVCSQIHRMSVAYGLNPADRARLDVPREPEGPSAFSELLHRMGGHL